MEKRFFRMLRCRRAIAGRNYFLWLGEAMRLAPRGISAIVQANKMYLRGVQILDERGEGDRNIFFCHKDGHEARGQASAPPRRNPRLPVPTFFARAIERVAWPGNAGAANLLKSAALKPLARETARTTAARLARSGVHGDIAEKKDGAARLDSSMLF